MTTSVLLYSGGMDSYIIACLWKPDVLLHVDTGTRYGAVEMEHLTPPPGQTITQAVLRDLARWENPDTFILPARNLHLVLLGAHYGDRIWLGATAGDRTRDKDDRFAELTTTLLSHIYGDQWWLPGGRDVRVELPAKPFTKRQLVNKYLTAGMDPNHLITDTFSCYTPVAGHPCGGCKPCVRKWIALVAEGVHPKYTVTETALATVTGRGNEDGDVADALHQWEAWGYGLPRHPLPSGTYPDGYGEQ